MEEKLKEIQDLINDHNSKNNMQIIGLEIDQIYNIYNKNKYKMALKLEYHG